MDRVAYYRYLVRTVPPGAVARSAARKLFRAMGARAARHLGEALRSDGLTAPFNAVVVPPAARELLAAAGARTAAELPAALARPLPGALALGSPAGVAAAAAALRAETPDEALAAIARAERAMAGRCTIFGAEVELPLADRLVPQASAGYRAIDWDRDPTTGARFDRGGTPPGGDPKRPWAVGRLEEAVHLALGAVLEPSPERARAFADRALDRFLDLAVAPRGIQWTCPMEVALRALDGAIVLRLLAGGPALAERPGALLEILRSLAFHVRFVDAHLEDTGTVPNNHLVGDLVGILGVAALLPPLAGLVPSARRASARLGEELLAQTLPDGTSFEGSVPYHRLAVELFALAHLLGGIAGAPLPERASSRLYRMFEALRELRDGRGLLPQIGDNDSGRALPFRPRHPQEGLWLLPLGAVLFDRAELKLADGPPPPELLWLLGPAAAARLRRLPATAPARDGALPDGGFWVLRSRRLSCAIACGPNGTGGTGGHGHNDKLSIEVCVDGRLAIGDPGALVYTADPATRNRFRGTAAHSTVQVEGAEQQELPAGRLFALPEQARARCLAFVPGADRTRFAGEHRGYERLATPAIHRREVLLVRDPDGIVITDVLAGAGALRAEARFLVPGQASVRPATRAETRRLERLAPQVRSWDRAHVVAIGPAEAPLALLFAAGAAGAPRLGAAEYAEGYGERRPAVSVSLPLSGGLPIVCFVAIVPGTEPVTVRGEVRGC